MLNNTFVSGAVNTSYTAHQTGYYQVRVTNASGCYSTSDSAFVNVTGIADEELDMAKPLIYPNPFTHSFTISISKDVKDLDKYSFEIMNDVGQLVYSRSTLDYSNVIEFKDMSSGVYMIRLKHGDEFRTYKVIKVD